MADCDCWRKSVCQPIGFGMLSCSNVPVWVGLGRKLDFVVHTKQHATLHHNRPALHQIPPSSCLFRHVACLPRLRTATLPPLATQATALMMFLHPTITFRLFRFNFLQGATLGPT